MSQSKIDRDMEDLKCCPNPDCDATWERLVLRSWNASSYQYHSICCDGCDMRGPECGTSEEAFAAWNKLPREEEKPIPYRMANGSEIDLPSCRSHLAPLAKCEPAAITPEMFETTAQNMVKDGIYSSISFTRDFGYDELDAYINISNNAENQAMREGFMTAMHQPCDDDKPIPYYMVQGSGALPNLGACVPVEEPEPEKEEEAPQGDTAPVNKDKWPHVCPIKECGAPAYLAGPGYSECSNPDCDLK